MEKENEDTSEWETYVDEKYTFQLKYPVSPFVRLICPDENLLLIERDLQTENTVTMQQICARDGRYDFEVVVTDQLSDQPSSNEYFLVTETSTAIDGIPANKYHFVAKKTEGFPGAGSEFYEIRFQKDNIFFTIHASMYTKDYLDQILSTFKFVEKTTDTNCKSKDTAFCQDVEKYRSIVSSEDPKELITKTMESQLTCDSSSPFPMPFVCNGIKDGEKTYGYQIGYNQSEGSMLSRGEYEELLTISFNDNNFHYQGSHSLNDRGIIVFTDTPEEDLFALYLLKDEKGWQVKQLMLGVVSDDFLRIDSRLLDFIR